jgi:hypothetical protein
MRFSPYIPTKKTGYEAWKEDKKNNPNPPQRRIQYELPKFAGNSETKKTYQWETDNLKGLSKKKYGKSYNDKFDNWAREQGIQDHEMSEFRKWLDAKEAGVKTYSGEMDVVHKNMEQRTKESAEKVKQNFKNPSKQEDKLTTERQNPKKKESNWYIDAHKAVDKKLIKPIEDKVGRFATDFADVFAANQVKKSLGKHDTPEFIKEWAKPAETKGEKVTSVAGQIAGMIAPVGAAYKATSPVAKVGYKALTKGQDLGKFAKYGQEAIKGATAMGTYSTTREGIDELLNPKDANLKERAKHVGMETALGFFGDPAVRLAGTGIKAGYQAGLKKLIPDVPLPKYDPKAIGESIKKLEVPKTKNLNDILQSFNQATKIPKSIDLGPVNVKKSNPKQIIDDIIEKQLQEPPVTSKTVSKTEIAPTKMDVDTSLIDDNIEALTRRLEEVKPKPTQKQVTKTEIDDQLRSLEINEGYLRSGHQKGTISEADYRRKMDENEAKRQALAEQQKTFTNEVPDELKHTWNNEKKGYELGDYITKQAYGGGYAVQKGIKTLQKFRTQEEATQFMQESVAAERGLNVSFDKEGVLRWKSTYDEAGKKWDIQSGDYSIHRGGKDNWTVKKNDEVIGTYKTEKKAREQAQRHFDSNHPDPNSEPAILEQQIKDLTKQRDELIQSPRTEAEGASGDPSEINSTDLKERGHIETLRNSENATDSLKERIKGMYEPITNEETVKIANQQISKGLDSAVSFVKSAVKIEPQHVATAHRLIQEFQKNGQIERAVDMAEYIAEQGTKAGQTVQAFSIFDRLSPEGILIHAKRVADRVNAKLNPLQQKVVVTKDTAEKLTDLATSVQKMTEHKTVANDIITLMDKVKSGTKLTDDEVKQVRQFYDDARQFVQDLAPKQSKPRPPKKIANNEIKKQVVSFLDKQEEAARKRLAQRKGRALSGLPVDDFYDYTVIGAAKLAKGTIEFAEFSEQMIKEFGEEIAPHIHQIYDKAAQMVNNEAKRTVNRLPEVQKIVEKAIKNGKVEVNEAENLRKFAKSIADMSGDAKLEASQELQAVLQLLERPSLLQQISSAQTIAQLLNPKTLNRNAIGNELFYRLERINKYLATPIDWAKVKVIGGKRSVTFRTYNQGQYWKDWLKGAKAGWKGVNPGGLTTQYDIRPNSFSGKANPFTYMEKLLGVTLKSFDYAGYQRAVNNTLGELATLRAINEGLIGQARKPAIERYIREADENVLAIADQYGKYVTFQDNNVLSVGLQKVKRGLNFGKDWGAGDLILKYPRTPGSLLMRALEYSPAGFLKSAYAIAKPFYNKNFMWSEVIESFTRATIGTGAAGITWFMADVGIITGSGSKDFDVKELEQTAGKSEYSLNVDALYRWVISGFNADVAQPVEGDRFVSYNWAQPIATAISIGANVQQNYEDSGDFKIGNAVYSAVDGALDTMVNTSVLQGLKKATESYPGQSTMDKATDILGEVPASFVPTAFNQVRQYTDNTGRNTYDPSKGQSFMNRAINKIPGLASKLPEGYDTLGNKKQVYQGETNNLFNVFLNPSFVRKYQPSPEALMVLDIINDTGDTSVAPRRAAKYLQIDGKRYDLTPEQYSDYQRRLGEATRIGLQEISTGGDPEEVAGEIYKMLNEIGRQVREELKAEYQ